MNHFKISFFTFVLLLSLLLFLPSCTYTVEENGLENFSIHDSETSLTKFLIPNDFLNTFPYVDGDYIYYDHLSHNREYETALLYMKYDEGVYETAKAYVFENMGFVEGVEESYNGYIVLQRKLSSEMQKDKRCFFAYSDEQKTLLAVGTHMNEYNYTSIKDYFDTYFPFYNFEEGQIERSKENSTTET